jgi:hypothetical protein
VWAEKTHIALATMALTTYSCLDRVIFMMSTSPLPLPNLAALAEHLNTMQKQLHQQMSASTAPAIWTASGGSCRYVGIASPPRGGGGWNGLNHSLP